MAKHEQGRSRRQRDVRRRRDERAFLFDKDLSPKAKEFWGRSAEEALAIYRRWQKKRGKQ